MRLKTNLIISVIFIALLGFVYFYEIKGGEERKIAAERARQLLDFSDHEVARLSIDHGDTLLVLEKDGDAWRVVKPVETGVDRSAVERYLRNLRETEVEGDLVQDSAAVAADPGLLAEYGLDAPRLKVRLELAGDAQPALDTVRFGEDTPTERFAYAQRSGANPEVFLVRAWRFDNLNKGLFDLRDRRLLAFEKDDVKRLRLVRGGEPVVELERRDEGWELLSPLRRLAASDAVDGLLSKLHNAEAAAVVHETPSADELAAAGLDAASQPLQVVLLIGEDLGEKRLLVGREREDGDFLARDHNRPQVFTVDSTVVNELRKPVSELRDKRLLRVQADDVARIELERDGQVVFVARRDTAGGWTLEGTSDREPKTWRLNSLVTDLDGLEAAEFVADAADSADLPLAPYGLDAPRLKIRVEMTDGQVRQLRVGDSTSDGDAYASRDGVASVARVDGDDVEALDLGLDEVSTETPSQTEAADVEADAS